MPIKHTNRKKPTSKNKSYVSKAAFNKMIEKIIKIKKTGSGKITFYYRDGSMKSMAFSQKLLQNEDGSDKSFGDIISIVNDLKHDFKAMYFLIT